MNLVTSGILLVLSAQTRLPSNDILEVQLLQGGPDSGLVRIGMFGLDLFKDGLDELILGGPSRIQKFGKLGFLLLFLLFSRRRLSTGLVGGLLRFGAARIVGRELVVVVDCVDDLLSFGFLRGHDQNWMAEEESQPRHVRYLLNRYHHLLILPTARQRR